MMSPKERQRRLAAFERVCRERGLAVTVQRRAVLEALLGGADHPTADQVYGAVVAKLPGVSRTTVYRVLETLVETGTIAKACTPGAATRYDAVTEQHHHLVCMQCGKLIDVDDEVVASTVELPSVSKRVFEVHSFSIRFHGVCGQCRRAGRREGNSGTGKGRAGRGC